MVYSLEVETTMEEVQLSRAVDNNGCAEHSLSERVVWTQISSRHGEMR